MRTGKITISGKEYLTCFSTRVLMALEDRGRSADAELQRIMEDGRITDVFWLLEHLIDAGNRYAELEGSDNPGKLTLDEIVDRVGVDEYQTMFKAVTDAVAKGNKPTVAVKTTKKNVKTTQDA